MEESMTLKRGVAPRIGANAPANDLTRELALAKQAARAAGEILRGYWSRGGPKSDRRDTTTRSLKPILRPTP